MVPTPLPGSAAIACTESLPLIEAHSRGLVTLSIGGTLSPLALGLGIAVGVAVACGGTVVVGTVRSSGARWTGEATTGGLGVGVAVGVGVGVRVGVAVGIAVGVGWLALTSSKLSSSRKN
jgi:hypothetical protein